MSGFVTLVQRSAVHLLVDGLSYAPDGRVMAVSQKTVALPVQGMAVTALGAGRALLMATIWIRRLFNTFDGFVAEAQPSMEAWFAELSDVFPVDGFEDRFVGNARDIQLVIAGWSVARNRPEAYLMTIGDRETAEAWASGPSKLSHNLFELVPIDGVTANPVPPDVLLEASGVRRAAPDRAAYLEMLDPEVDLLAIMECQRQMDIDGRHLIGGLALLTTVDADGLSQRVVHRWPGDRIGELVKPRPIDWPAWRAAHPRRMADAPEAGVGESPLRRQMRERRQAKAARRGGGR